VYACFGIATAFIYLASNHYVAFGLIGLSALGGATVAGPLFATIQSVVPQRMRAMAIALIYLFGNLIGMGLGPLAVGALSDVLTSWTGEESLRYALLIMCPGYLWGGWYLWRASRTVKRDIEIVQGMRARESRETSLV
jgi:MFS family permease